LARAGARLQKAIEAYVGLKLEEAQIWEEWGQALWTAYYLLASGLMYCKKAPQVPIPKTSRG